MKHKLYVLLALVGLPLTLYFSVSNLEQFKGPFYLGTNTDPDYVYLINSLNVARFKLPGHIDHPGTTVQVIGAVTLRVDHFFFGKGKIVDDVLARSEDYLQTIRTVFLWLNVIALYFCGFLVWQASKSVAFGLLFQCSSFLGKIPEQLLKVSAEPILIISTLIFCALLFRVFAKEDWEEKKAVYLPAFALLSAFSIATKITFAPLALVPFLLIKTWRDRFYFLLISGLGLCIFAFPLIFRWEYFWNWLTQLFYGAGMYGGGNQTVVDPSSFLHNLVTIITEQYLYIIILLLALVFILGRRFYIPLQTYCHRHPIRFTIIATAVFEFVFYVCLVAKHYHYHYLIPPIIFSIVILMAFIIIVPDIFPNSKLKWRWSFLFIVGIVLNVGYSFYEIRENFKNHLHSQNELIALINKQYSSSFRIYSYGSSCPEQALSFGIGYSYFELPVYASVLKRKYGNVYFFNFFNKTFYAWTPDHQVDIEVVLHDKGDVYFQLSNLVENGFVGDRIPIVGLNPGASPKKYIYVENLYQENLQYREAIYKLKRVGL